MRGLLLMGCLVCTSTALGAQGELRTRSMYRTPADPSLEVFARSDGSVGIESTRLTLDHYCLVSEENARVFASEIAAIIGRRITVAAGEQINTYVSAREASCTVRFVRITSSEGASFVLRQALRDDLFPVDVPLSRAQATLFRTALSVGADSTAAMTRRSEGAAEARSRRAEAVKPDRVFRDHELTVSSAPVGDSLRPHYPEQLRATGVQGSVFVQFIVDTLGRMESGSLRILEASDSLLVASVREALLDARFTPASILGIRVRHLKHERFSFGPLPAPKP